MFHVEQFKHPEIPSLNVPRGTVEGGVGIKPLEISATPLSKKKLCIFVARGRRTHKMSMETLKHKNLAGANFSGLPLQQQQKSLRRLSDSFGADKQIQKQVFTKQLPFDALKIAFVVCCIYAEVLVSGKSLWQLLQEYPFAFLVTGTAIGVWLGFRITAYIYFYKDLVAHNSDYQKTIARHYATITQTKPVHGNE